MAENDNNPSEMKRWLRNNKFLCASVVSQVKKIRKDIGLHTTYGDSRVHFCVVMSSLIFFNRYYQFYDWPKLSVSFLEKIRIFIWSDMETKLIHYRCQWMYIWNLHRRKKKIAGKSVTEKIKNSLNSWRKRVKMMINNRGLHIEHLLWNNKVNSIFAGFFSSCGQLGPPTFCIC